MAIESKIIFAIGSKSIGGFTELKSALDLMGQLWGKVKEATKELDQFSQMWQRTNQAAVLAADSAAGGLVDTTEVLRGYNKLIASGAKITDEQFKIITARAAEMAQVTGTDATDAFKRLTNDISKGTTRSLKEYGVSIKTSTDLTKTQKAAIEGLTEGYEGLSVNAQTTTERMFALENNIGTLHALMYDAVGSSQAFAGSLDSLNGALGEFNTWLAESPTAVTDWMFSIDGATDAVAEFALQWMRFFSRPIVGLEKWILGLMGAPEGVTGAFQKAFDTATGRLEAGLDVRRDEQARKRNAEAINRKESGVGSGKGIRPRRRGGGGGGGRGKENEMVFTEADVDKFEQQELDEFFEPSSTDVIGNLSNDDLAERLTLLQEYSDFMDEEEERKKRMMELAQEEAEQAKEIREQEIQQANERKQAWIQSFDESTAAARKESKWLRVLNIGVAESIKASQKQQENAGAAIVGVLGEVGGAIAEEAGWQIAMEVARGIAALAAQNYVAAAGHAAAAVAFGVAAAQTGKGSSKAATAKAPSQSASQRFTGGGQDFGAARDSGGSKEFTVSIQMKEGAGGWFDAIVDENDRASIDGRRNFSGSN